LPRSRLKEARSRLPGWEFLHINTHKRASPVAGMKVQRCRRKLFLTTVKTTQCNKIVPASGMKIHPAYRAVSLSGPARLPYKQALILLFVFEISLLIHEEIQRKIISVGIFICDRDFPWFTKTLITDFLDLHNVFFENYFANELTSYYSRCLDRWRLTY
jgi:hypothetical protein